MDFFCLVTLTAVLLLRPQEFYPVLDEMYLYTWCIAACAAVSVQQLVRQLRPGALMKAPITVWVLAFAASCVVSHLSPLLGSFSPYAARLHGGEVFKLVLFYLLVVGCLRTPRRFRAYLDALTVLGTFAIGASALDFHGYIDVPTIEHIEDKWTNPETGEREYVRRMQGMGMFADPNDVSLVLCVLGALSLGDAMSGRGLRRAWGLATLAFLGHALTLTQSRGGLMMVVVALGTALIVKYGLRRGAYVLGGLGLGASLLVAGRQSSIDLEGGTGQSRIQLWSESLTAFKSHPFTGVGMREITEHVPQVTHNSYLQAYAEMGLLGGTCFLALFLATAGTLLRARTGPGPTGRLRPYLLGATAGYMMGMMSLSRNYILMTYLMPALAMAYAALPGVLPPARPLPLRLQAARALAAGLAFLVFIYVFVRVFSRYG